MFQSFVIVLREAFEAFLIVSIIVAYLKKVKQDWLLPAVYWGVAASFVASFSLGWVLYQGVNTPLWEGVLGVVAAIMVTSLVLYMWKHGASMKSDMEKQLKEKISSRPSRWLSSASVFFFTVFMITREGMETALLLIQVPEGRIFVGTALGILATMGFAYLWVRFSSLINVKLFFQVTGIFLLLFVAQILFYSFHEFTEAGIIPNSEFLHAATEPYSSEGIYGRWFSVLTVLICAGWLIMGWLKNRVNKPSERVPAE